MTAHSSRAVVFTGPSLHPDEAATLLNATFLPPIKRGDIARLRDSQPAIVGIIDGEFYQNLAVTPKEVLSLLETGVSVYGGASMGALRAVELSRYGMKGVGSVFRLFRRGVLDADDEVALAYEKETFQAVSVPLINTRYALRAAVRQRILNRTEAGQIVARVKSAYFPQRTRALTLSIAAEILGSRRSNQLRDTLCDNAYDIKRTDAKLLVDRIRKDIELVAKPT